VKLNEISFKLWVSESKRFCKGGINIREKKE
jgi:hypothetical protein